MLLNCGVGKTFESFLDCKEIQPVHPKGIQSWTFIGRTDAEAEAPIIWPPVVKNLLIGKDPDAAKDWRQEKKGTTEDEMVGWHHWLNGHEFEQALSGRLWRTGKLGVLQSIGVAKSWTWLRDWTELNWIVDHLLEAQSRPVDRMCTGKFLYFLEKEKGSSRG